MLIPLFWWISAGRRIHLPTERCPGSGWWVHSSKEKSVLWFEESIINLVQNNIEIAIGSGIPALYCTIGSYISSTKRRLAGVYRIICWWHVNWSGDIRRNEWDFRQTKQSFQAESTRKGQIYAGIEFDSDQTKRFMKIYQVPSIHKLVEKCNQIDAKQVCNPNVQGFTFIKNWRRKLKDVVSSLLLTSRIIPLPFNWQKTGYCLFSRSSWSTVRPTM